MDGLLPHMPPGMSLTVFEDIDSTNRHARQLAEQGAAEGTVVWAKRQTAGRGRLGNTWESPEGNLYMTLILRPENLLPQAAGQLSFLAAVALADTLAAFLPEVEADIRLKWPNDVLLRGRKVAGILLESDAQAGKPLDWILIGIGVNLAHAPEGASSVAACGGDVSPARALEMLAARLMHFYGLWHAQGFGPVRQAWLSRAHHLGHEIRVRLPHETFTGIFHGIDHSGALDVEMSDGRRRHIASGEVFLP